MTLKTFGKIFCDMRKKKLELFGSFECCDIWCLTQTKRTSHIITAKHDGSTTTIWSSYDASGLLAVIDGTKNFAVFKKILKQNHQLSWIFLLCRAMIRNTTSSAPLSGKKKKKKVLQWPSESLCYSMTLDRQQHATCNAFWNNSAWMPDKIPPQQCERLTASYLKCLIAVLAANGGTANYLF